MTIDQILTLVEHAGLAGMSTVLWWLERKERLKLEMKLEDCLRGKDTRHSNGEGGGLQD